MAPTFKIYVFGDVSTLVKHYIEHYLGEVVSQIEYLPTKDCLNKPFIRDIVEGKYVIDLIKEDSLFRRFIIEDIDDLKNVVPQIKMVIQWHS